MNFHVRTTLLRHDEQDGHADFGQHREHHDIYLIITSATVALAGELPQCSTLSSISLLLSDIA